MPTFKAPQYTKVTNPRTGAQEPCYTFQADYQANEDGILFVADSQLDITLENLQKCILDNVEWWNTFVKQFLEASAKYFNKPYTVEQINKITRHTLNGSTIDGVTNIHYLPKTIQISGGVFTVNWSYKAEPVIIDIPDLETGNHVIEVNCLPDSNKIIEGLEELNIDELPAGSGSTDVPLELESPAKFYEKQRVKEARLKARLAVYKAQRTMAQYYEKYGDDISDSDSEIDSSDEDSGEDSEEEEVQL
jgi:hypothetical protein